MAKLKAAANRRSGGVLLHVTSLPGPHGIGDLGPSARRWVDALAEARQRWWQILPLGPAGAGDSPYQCYSAFAGNPLTISLEVLAEEGLLDARAVKAVRFPAGAIQFARVRRSKEAVLSQAWERFRDGRRGGRLRDAYDRFADEQSDWLDDYALFMALREARRGVSWTDWPADLVRRRPAAVAEARHALADEVGRHAFLQFVFFRQLDALRAYARERNVKLIGDLPIFVSPESADVWTHPHLFELDRHRRPRAVAGVPPDLFAKTGQRWGNPLYDWAAMARDGYDWWVRRLRASLTQSDLVRFDHFRGFEAYWRIPASSPTAETGRWVKGPGAALFEALRRRIGSLPLIAEDLGVITPAVEALRDGFDLPGMRILQFAVGGDASNTHLPHNYPRRSVAYTGTHDNDTSAGWFGSLPPKDKAQCRALLALPKNAGKPDVCDGMIRAAWASVADLAIVPAQDLLALPRSARMNTPGRPNGNWRWRLDDLTDLKPAMDRLRSLTELYGRGE